VGVVAQDAVLVGRLPAPAVDVVDVVAHARRVEQPLVLVEVLGAGQRRRVGLDARPVLVGQQQDGRRALGDRPVGEVRGGLAAGLEPDLDVVAGFVPET
jgi:hypothetical protein